MQKINIFLAILFSGISVAAQSIKLPAGKKLSVITETKLASSTTVMGNQMDIDNTSTNFADYEVKTVSNTGYSMNMTLKRLKTYVSVAGNEQTFDTDDESARNNPQYAELFKELNKPNEIEVGAGGVTGKGDVFSKAIRMGIPANETDQAKYILMQKDINRLAPGKQWSDSTHSEGNRAISEYLVSKADEATAEVLVKTELHVNTTLKEFGMDVKQIMQGTVNAKRLYNRLTGQLLKEDSEMVISGSMEMMGQSSPLNIKGKTTTTVN